MINKNKVNEILNHKGDKKSHTGINEDTERIEYETEIQKAGKCSLTVIICKEELSARYNALREGIADMLICENIRYINSVNHLDNVERIILDAESFEDKKEIAFLLNVFRLLHRHCEMIVAADPTQITELKRVISNSEDIYALDNSNVNTESLKHAVKLSDLNDYRQKKKWHIRKYIKFMITVFLITAIISGICLAAYIFFNQKESDIKLYNQNMNVQLDMGENTILPINTVYSDEKGNHVIIEEISNDKNKETVISLFDSKLDYIVSDLKNDECPNQKCSRHYELTFSDKETDYYILQIENGTSVKNVEIDARYFK